jgi:serine/threonine-protein kinase PknG
MTACTQPGCTGSIVDGYCDVCGSPGGSGSGGGSGEWQWQLRTESRQ